MPTTITHIIAGSAIGYSLYPDKKDFRFWLGLVLLSAMPDIDVITFTLGLDYSHPFGHRGFTHSILFALITGIIFVFLMYRESAVTSGQFRQLSAVFFAAACAHAFLDSMTSGGLGVGVFMPFNNNRYFLPWRPIKVSPIRIADFSGEWGYRVFKSELMIVVVPSIVLIILVRIKRLFKKG
jgi:inner membrane protein